MGGVEVNFSFVGYIYIALNGTFCKEMECRASSITAPRERSSADVLIPVAGATREKWNSFASLA